MVKRESQELLVRFQNVLQCYCKFIEEGYNATYHHTKKVVYFFLKNTTSTLGMYILCREDFINTHETDTNYIQTLNNNLNLQHLAQ